MSEVCAILPLKAFEHAKSRLSPALSAAERAELARLMALDSLRTLSAVPAIDRVVIAGQSHAHAALADEFECDYIADDPALDVSENVLRAAGLAVTPRTATLLYIAADLPLVRPGDVNALLASHRSGLTVCRAIRDNGTNALLATPPALACFCFGSGSAARHAVAARAAGANVRIRDLPAFQRDLDEPGDLPWIFGQGDRGAAVAYLRQSGAFRREAAWPATSLAFPRS